MKRKFLSLFLIILLFLCLCNACGTKNDNDKDLSDNPEGEGVDLMEETEPPTMTEPPNEEEADPVEETEPPIITQPPKEDETEDDYKVTDRASLNKDTAEDYQETKFYMKKDYYIKRFNVMKDGKLFSISGYYGRILTWDGKEWKTGGIGKGLTKSLKKNEEMRYEIVGYSDEGLFYVIQYVYGVGDSSDKMTNSILHEFTEDGELLYSYDLKKLREEEIVRVSYCYPIGNHEVVMRFGADDYNYRFDLKNGKLSRYEEIPESYLTLKFVKDGKMYFIDEDEENRGFITVRDVESGKILNMIDYTPLHTGVLEDDFYEGWDRMDRSYEESDGSEEEWSAEGNGKRLNFKKIYGKKTLLEHQEPTLDVYDGKLYAAHITGIYVWNEQDGTWDMVVDAYKGKMDLRLTYINCFKVVEEGVFYCMGKSGLDGEAETANMFYEYRKK